MYLLYLGYYFTGDGAATDKNGYFHITGRVDDVINVSGHRIGTAEIEDALVHIFKILNKLILCQQVMKKFQHIA